MDDQITAAANIFFPFFFSPFQYFWSCWSRLVSHDTDQALYGDRQAPQRDGLQLLPEGERQYVVGV